MNISEIAAIVKFAITAEVKVLAINELGKQITWSQHAIYGQAEQKIRINIENSALDL